MVNPSDELAGDGAEDVLGQEDVLSQEDADDDSDHEVGPPTLPLVSLKCRKRACKRFGTLYKYSSALFNHER